MDTRRYILIQSVGQRCQANSNIRNDIAKKKIALEKERAEKE